MAKTPPEELVSESKEELVTFLRNGEINERRLSESLDYSGLDIDSFDRIKEVHFVLSEPVLSFVRELPGRIRRIKKESRRSSNVTHGRVEGKVDWGRTTKLRNSDNYGDRSVFACETPSYEYDIPENLVLKKVLGIVYEIVTRELESVEYDWRTKTWGEELITEMKDIFDKNVHVNRIRRHGKIDLRARDLDAARKSRNPLYYEAYELYDRYERLMGDELGEDVERLLLETLVEPRRVSTLFELFAVFKIVENLRNEYPVSLRVIEPGSEEIARMESEERVVKVFHDKQGDLNFYVPVDRIGDIENEYLRRYKQVIEEHRQLLGEFLGKGVNESLYQGRPDIVVEVFERDDGLRLDSVLLGEVKYTESEATFSQGLKELLEYMKYARMDDTHLDEMGCDLSGLIVTDGVDASGQKNSVRSIDTDDLLRGVDGLLGG
jgi:hypothetical protein